MSLIKPLKITVWRRWLFSDESIGKLYVNGKFFGIYTLEDEVRPAGEKVYADTAIPYGKYPVEITYSPTFKREMPLIENVPGFTGIRIHTGTTDKDTAGCLLVGTGYVGRSLTGSKDAFEKLYDKIRVAQDEGRPVQISFVNTEKFYAQRMALGIAAILILTLIYQFIVKPQLNRK